MSWFSLLLSSWASCGHVLTMATVLIALESGSRYEVPFWVTFGTNLSSLHGHSLLSFQVCFHWLSIIAEALFFVIKYSVPTASEPSTQETSPAIVTILRYSLKFSRAFSGSLSVSTGSLHLDRLKRKPAQNYCPAPSFPNPKLSVGHHEGSFPMWTNADHWRQQVSLFYLASYGLWHKKSNLRSPKEPCFSSTKPSVWKWSGYFISYVNVLSSPQRTIRDLCHTGEEKWIHHSPMEEAKGQCWVYEFNM